MVNVYYMHGKKLLLQAVVWLAGFMKFTEDTGQSGTRMPKWALEVDVNGFSSPILYLLLGSSILKTVVGFDTMLFRAGFFNVIHFRFTCP